VVEKAYFVKNLNSLSIVPHNANVIYIGSEYCLKAFPSHYYEIIKKCNKEFKIGILTPPLLESDRKRFIQIFTKTTEILNAGFEVIVNDWGVLNYLQEYKSEKINIVLGRLLSYQKRGYQKLYGLFDQSLLSYVPILNDKNVNFLKKLGVKRVEIDIPPWGVNFNLDVDISISVYMPFSIQSYTINCPFTFSGVGWDKKCRRECLESYLTYDGGDSVCKFIQCGKIYYSEIKTQDNVNFADRIVYIKW